jgi:primosomal protein N'
MQCGEEIAFLKKAHGSALSLLSGDAYQGVEVFDIVQSPIQKISNRYRAQLLTTGENSVVLRQFLGDWMVKLDKLPKKGKLRWSLDVDPVDFS